MEDENDPVIKEIPVFLSKTLLDKLYIIRFPIPIVNGDSENSTSFKSSCIKPENKEIRLEYVLDTESVNYDPTKGKQLATNAAEEDCKKDGNSSDNIYDSQMLDTIMLTSSQDLSDATNFAVGIFQDEELHITPLKTILVMQPQMDFLEKNEKRTKDETISMGEGENDDEDEDNASPVKVTFARVLPDHLKKMEENSFQQHSKKSKEELWIPTNYVPSCTQQAELTRMEMFCPSTEESVNSLNLTSQQYLDLMMPKYQKFNKAYLRGMTHSQQNCTMFSDNNENLSLLDQIKAIMKRGRVMSFLELCTNLSSTHDTATMLRYLQQVAVLVQGNWIVNSELIYPKDTLSWYNGIPAEFMCRARDYVLLSFTEQEFVNRKMISPVVNLPSEEIKQIFEELGTHEVRKGWKLYIPPNNDFCRRYPEISQRQEMLWEAKRKYLRESMETQIQPPQRQRRKSNRELVGSENEERNVGRTRKSLRDSSLSDNDSTPEFSKQKKINRSRKTSETTM